MTNSADPDQLASSEASCSGSTMFAKIRHVVFNKRRVKDRCNLSVSYIFVHGRYVFLFFFYIHLFLCCCFCYCFVRSSLFRLCIMFYTSYSLTVISY